MAEYVAVDGIIILTGVAPNIPVDPEIWAKSNLIATNYSIPGVYCYCLNDNIEALEFIILKKMKSSSKRKALNDLTSSVKKCVRPDESP